MKCQLCGRVGLEERCGFFYCPKGHQVHGIMATAVDTDEMLLTKEHLSGYVRRPVVKPAPLSQSKPRPKFWVNLEDGVGLFEPGDPSYDDYCKEMRKTYVMGVQIMIELQIKALVEEFKPIFSTDIIKWAVEGKLPYFDAFVEINISLELPRPVCPLTSSFMFRPTRAIPVQKLESLAASIAQSIGLELPPVNFSAIASRYLEQLSLPVNIILPHAYRIYEWSMPPELWLSASEFMLPTHAFTLSILVVSIRVLYNIHGFGKWEMSLSCAIKGKKSKVNNAAEPCNKDLDATEILVLLQSKYNELIDASDHAKDLEAYLDHCERVVFAGVELSYKDQVEDEIIKRLLQFYNEKKKDHKPLEPCFLSPSNPHKRPLDHNGSNTNQTKKPKNDNVQDLYIMHTPNIECHRDREIRRMKSNMKENKFCYIPPRKRVKRHYYLHYTRKKGGGAYVYAAHADYYILLRSCARVGQLNVRSMHDAVLSFERRLGWLEKNIQHSFKQMPRYEDCELCHDCNSVNHKPKVECIV
ncbi:hypothetical protein L1987_05139 [Smallanthus sonchifolius]|uniref:Uncharacterized protein n=1 Tax=Smallanthus sonchifolius TaxID=185202 RepID=A0ACB9JUV9_9ASTR|nr:hypothetical protein L1987_05139 [Smallanthus sonchifolius]